MKFTSFKTTKGNKLQMGVHDAEWFMQRITHETRDFFTTGFREYLKSYDGWGRYRFMNEIPRLCAGAEYKRTPTGDVVLARNNGLVVLEVREVADAAACEALKQRAMLSPSTWAAFVGASGRTVRLLVRVAPQQGALPQAEVEAEDFYALAYRHLLAIYDSILGCRVTRLEPRLRYAFLLPLDEHPLVNPSAVPFRIDPMAAPPADDAEEHLLALPEPPRDHRDIDMATYQIHAQQYEAAAQTVLAGLDHMERHTGAWLRAFVTGVLAALGRQGMGQEEAVCVTWNALKFKDYPGLTEEFVRTVAAAAYAELPPRRTAADSAENNLMRSLIRRIETRYVLRYNTIMGYAEYRPNHTWATPWRPVTDAVINTFTTDLMLSGLQVWDRDVRRYVFSTRVRHYNPIGEYLVRCHNKWDGRDRIRALAATVPTDTPAEWAEWFHTWFLAMVAQWLGRDRRFGNAIVPLLISGQGMHKSTFCRNLLPQELRSWGYTDNLSLAEERPVHLAMSQMLLVNLDEFNRLSPATQQGFLKNILQLPSVKVKRPYAKHIEEVPRLASFIATTNMADVLTDPSGSRRFIGVRVTGDIDVSVRPDHEQLFAQAYAELEAGARYWFDGPETEAIMAHNRQFEQLSGSLQFFLEHFEPGTAEGGRWMTAAALLEELKKHAGAAFKPTPLNTFGRQLNGCPSLQHRHTKCGQAYWVQDRIRA